MHDIQLGNTVTMTTVLPWQFVRIICVVGVWRMFTLVPKYTNHAEFPFPSLNIYSVSCMEAALIQFFNSTEIHIYT